MCLSQSAPEVEKYKTSAQSQEPDNGAAQTAAARRATDKMRGTATVLTGAQGVTTVSPSQKNVLLGV